MREEFGTAFLLEQYEAIYPAGVERHYWNRCRNQVILGAVRSLGDPGKMLEVGCGKGLVVAFLRKSGCDITGVELAGVEPVEEAKSHVRTNTDALDLPADERNRVRTILLLDVIEHLEDPVAFMAHLATGFPALRHLVITVPARQELFSNYDEFNGHFRRYDRLLLKKQVIAANGTIRRAEYFFHLLYPAAWLQLRLARHRKLSFSVPAKGLASGVHGLLGRFFLLDRKLLPGSWPGTSIIATVDMHVSPTPPGVDP
jgi:2-polyprenyl-3-methyl-5-hydroxy-6-metoxy-1,4-benzoquinol methylase